jgi:hypothetical protein
VAFESVFLTETVVCLLLLVVAMMFRAIAWGGRVGKCLNYAVVLMDAVGIVAEEAALAENI